MKKILISLLTISLIFNTWCSLFKKQESTQQKQQTSQTIQTKSIEQIQWQDVYNYILDNGFAIQDAIKISKNILNWPARQDNGNINLAINGESVDGYINGKFNLITSWITSVKNNILKSLWNYKLNFEGKAKFQWQNINLSWNIDFSLFIKDVETYIKLNNFDLKQNLNPFYDTIISMYSQNIIGKRIKLTSANQYQTKNIKLDYTNYIKLISSLLEGIKKYPLIDSYKKEVKDNKKIFYIKLNKQNLKKVFKNALEQFPNIFQTTEEEKERMKENLEEEYKRLEKEIDKLEEIKWTAIVESLDKFVIDFWERKVEDETIKIKIIWNGKENTYLQIDIKTKDGTISIKSGKIDGKYTILSWNINTQEGNISGYLNTDYKLEDNKFNYTLDGIINWQIKDRQNNIKFEIKMSTNNTSKKLEKINLKEPKNYITIEEIMKQILWGNNMMLPQQNQQFNVEELNK